MFDVSRKRAYFLISLLCIIFITLYFFLNITFWTNFCRLFYINPWTNVKYYTCNFLYLNLWNLTLSSHRCSEWISICLDIFLQFQNKKNCATNKQKRVHQQCKLIRQTDSNKVVIAYWCSLKMIIWNRVKTDDFSLPLKF